MYLNKGENKIRVPKAHKILSVRIRMDHNKPFTLLAREMPKICGNSRLGMGKLPADPWEYIVYQEDSDLMVEFNHMARKRTYVEVEYLVFRRV